MPRPATDSQPVNHLADIPHLGRTIAARLARIGIHHLADLAAVGAPQAYRQLQAAFPEKRLPRCYYLYALQGALLGCDWRTLSDTEKAALRREAERL